VEICGKRYDLFVRYSLIVFIIKIVIKFFGVKAMKLLEHLT